MQYGRKDPVEKTTKTKQKKTIIVMAAVAMIGFIFLFCIFPYPTPPYFPWTPQLIGDHESGRTENVRVTLAASPWTEYGNGKESPMLGRWPKRAMEKIETFPPLIIFRVYTTKSLLSSSIQFGKSLFSAQSGFFSLYTYIHIRLLLSLSFIFSFSSSSFISLPFFFPKL